MLVSAEKLAALLGALDHQIHSEQFGVDRELWHCGIQVEDAPLLVWEPVILFLLQLAGVTIVFVGLMAQTKPDHVGFVVPSDALCLVARQRIKVWA